MKNKEDTIIDIAPRQHEKEVDILVDTIIAEIENYVEKSQRITLYKNNRELWEDIINKLTDKKLYEI